MKKIQLWQKVLIGLVLGAIIGLIFKEKAIYLKPVGDIFIRLLKMIIIPLIFLAIVSGIGNVDNPKKLGKVAFKASVYYMILTTISVFVGIFVANFLKPGHGLIINSGYQHKADKISSITETIVNIVPDNIFGAMSASNFLQIVFFAIFTGCILSIMAKSEKDRLVKIFTLLSSLIFKMVNAIINLAPYGAFAITAHMVGTQGMGTIEKLLMLIVAAYVTFGVLYAVFGLMIKLFSKLSPVPFYKKSLKYQSIAFSTSSSKASLPVTIDVCKNGLGVSEIGSSFILPLGASMNMSGLSAYLSIVAIFFAQAMGKTLSFYDYSLIIFTSTLGSIGGAGIPSGAIVMMPLVLTSIGLPLEGIGLIIGIDRIIDMMRTVISITGDAAVSVIIDAQSGTLDEKKYYSKSI